MNTHTFSKKTGRITLTAKFKKSLESDYSEFAVAGALTYLKTALSKMTGKNCFIYNPPERELLPHDDTFLSINIRKWIIDGLMIQPTQDLMTVLKTLELLDMSLNDKQIGACDVLIVEKNGKNITMTSPKELLDNGLKIVERNPKPDNPPIEEDCCLCSVDIEKTIEENNLNLVGKNTTYETISKKALNKQVN